MTIRELFRNAIEDAFELGTYCGLRSTPGKMKAVQDQRESRDALRAAIDRLERKAATAKAECEAWKAAMECRVVQYNSNTIDGKDELAAYRAVLYRLVDARAATDEAWREPESKETQPCTRDSGR